MELDIDQVKHLASLARIDLSRENLEELSKKLGIYLINLISPGIKS
ncbi:MAG: hypothetical protein Ct9H300mP27_09880 [Chloroflexota bacterium]|nr:MAG: hypothetical protein Ct9H300mP27_09880 [Chloroflexota bacterium]